MPLFTFPAHLTAFLDTGRSTVTLQDQVARWFEEARDDVYRYLLIIGLPPAQAQEATQEVFLRLYIAMRKGERIENWRGWVFRVAHNLGLKIRARQQGQAPFDADLEAKLSAPGADPEQTLLDRERLARLHRAMQGLSEQQKRCLHLRMEGLRHAEIGETLGISASTVSEFLRRAIARLRKAANE